MAIGPAATLRQRRRRHRIPVVFVVCSIFISAVVTMAVLGSWLAPDNPSATNLLSALAGPSSQHLLGTDALGRDMLSRIIAGARSALIGPLVIALVALAVGSTLGMLAGFRGGRFDAVTMRWVDLMYALPSLLVAIVLVGVFGGDYWLAVALLALFTAPYDTRLIRGATLEQRPLPYVEAARVIGLPTWRILALHIWPNVRPVAIANSFLNFAVALVALSGLSYLGLGVNSSSSDWGLMLAQNRTALFQTPVVALAPAAAIILTATAMNLIGDWLGEWLADRGRAR